MLLGTLNRLADHDDIQGLGEGGVLSAGAGHINETFLETDDLTSGNNSSTLQNMGTTGTDGIHLVVHDTGENHTGALNLTTGLDNVLNRGDANALAGLSNVKADGLDELLHIVVIVDIFLYFFGIDVQNAVFNGTFV